MKNSTHIYWTSKFKHGQSRLGCDTNTVYGNTSYEQLLYTIARESRKHSLDPGAIVSWQDSCQTPKVSWWVKQWPACWYSMKVRTVCRKMWADTVARQGFHGGSLPRTYIHRMALPNINDWRLHPRHWVDHKVGQEGPLWTSNWTEGHVHVMADGYLGGQDSEGWMVQKYVLGVWHPGK